MASKYLSPSDLIRAINQEFGENTLVRASDAAGLVRRRVSTGSLSLDILLGGGYPEGAITLLEGESQASKSWHLNKMASNFLNEYPEAVYILVNAEGTNDAVFLSMLGVDINRAFFLQPDSGEQAWDACIKAASLARKVFIGVDSLDACTPMAEINDDIADHHMAPAARLNNKGFRKLVAAMKSDITTNDARVTAVFITQLRDNIGVMFGDKKCSVGGKGKKFAATTIIRLACVGQLRDDSGGKDAMKITYGLTVEASIVKNKGSGGGDKVRFDLYKENYKGFKRGDIDNVTELIPFLLQYGLMTKAGNRYVLDGTSYTEDSFTKLVKSDSDILTALIDKVKAEVGKRHTVATATVEAEPEEVVEEQTRAKLPIRVKVKSKLKSR